jgi:hypothetical protein
MADGVEEDRGRGSLPWGKAHQVILDELSGCLLETVEERPNAPESARGGLYEELAVPTGIADAMLVGKRAVSPVSIAGTSIPQLTWSKRLLESAGSHRVDSRLIETMGHRRIPRACTD